MIFFYMQHLCKTSMDVTKRWVNEAQEAVNTDNVMVQYHALGLLYHIRKHDKLAVNKLVQKFTRGQLKSPYAMCLLVSAYSILCFFLSFPCSCSVIFHAEVLWMFEFFLKKMGGT